MFSTYFLAHPRIGCNISFHLSPIADVVVIAVLLIAGELRS